jgi:lysozyme
MRSAREGAEVSPADAELLLRYDLMPVEGAVNDAVDVPLSQNQYDALCAFAFNVGVDDFRASDVLSRLNEGRSTEAAYALGSWRRAELSEEVRRRAAEAALFLTPDGGSGHEPAAKPVEPVLEREHLPRDAVVFNITAAVVEAVVEVEPEPAAVAPFPPDAGTPQELAAEALEASEPGAEAIEGAASASTMAAVAYFAPAEPANDAVVAREPEPVETAPEPEPELPLPAPPPPPSSPQPSPPPLRAIPESFGGSRSYGPMAAAAMGVAERPDAPQLELAPLQPVSGFGPPTPPTEETAAAVTPLEALHTDTRLPPAALVLTPPPENFDRPDAPGPAEPAPAEPSWGDEATDAPLFEGWEGGPSNRIVRHETPADEAPTSRRPGRGLLLLSAIVGMAAFLGAVAAFLKGRAGGADDMTTYAWALALIGVGCVATSVYFLLKRLGGVSD